MAGRGARFHPGDSSGDLWHSGAFFHSSHRGDLGFHFLEPNHLWPLPAGSGRNEQAARYSGIHTDKMIVMAYLICAGLAGLGGVLFILDVNSAQPVDFGNFYELYAIAAAVLGGCSLRGGQGTILGVVIGAALMQILRNMITLVDWIPTHIEYAVIGAVILVGVVADEIVKRVAAARKAAASRKLWLSFKILPQTWSLNGFQYQFFVRRQTSWKWAAVMRTQGMRYRVMVIAKSHSKSQ